MHQSLMSRKMTLESCTLVPMLEAYAYFVMLGNMEETYDKILKASLVARYSYESLTIRITVFWIKFG